MFVRVGLDRVHEHGMFSHLDFLRGECEEGGRHKFTGEVAMTRYGYRGFWRCVKCEDFWPAHPLQEVDDDMLPVH